MKKIRAKLHLDRETVRTLSARSIEVVAGGAPKPSTDTDCVYCPLYSIRSISAR